MTSRGHTAVALVVVGVLFLALVLPLGWRGGSSAEEAVGLTSVAPERWYPTDVSVARSEARGGPGLRSSHRIPVWGYVSEKGAYRPIMIDGHQSAWSFYPSRLLVALGGLRAARVGMAAFGVLMLLGIFAVAREVGGTRVALVAVVLAATTGQVLWIHSWVRPDEQLDSLCHLGAVLAAVRYARKDRLRWFMLACLLLGAGVAAKNTAAWTAAAMVAAAALFRVMPRARLRHWIMGGALCLAPLVPQLLFMAIGDDTGAMSSRLSTISAPWRGLAPDQLAYSVGHFAESVGSGGALVARYMDGRGAGDLPLPVAGYALFAAMLLAVGGALSAATPKAARVFGAGLGFLLLQYLALYYRGESYWLLLIPWIPIAAASAGVGLWNAAAGVQSVARRRLACALVAALGLGIMANNAADVTRLHRAMARPGSAMFSLRAQTWATQQLLARGDVRPFTTTFGLVGVFEVLSASRLRPRHLFPYFHAAGDDPRRAETAWDEIFQRMGPGRHTIVLTPNPSRVETSPLVRGDLIADTFRTAAIRRGGLVTPVAVFEGPRGAPILQIVSLAFAPGGRWAPAGTSK